MYYLITLLTSFCVFIVGFSCPHRSQNSPLTCPEPIAAQELAYSPPKYPSPWASGSGDWADAYAKATVFVSQLTLLEKVNLTTGTGYGL